MPVTTAKKAAAKKAAPAKSAVQATITLKHLAAALADSHDIAKKQAEAVLGDLVTLTTRHLKKGAKIRLTGLGILQVRKRAATDGTESGDRRGHQDQGEQEGRIPGREGTERSGVGRAAERPNHLVTIRPHWHVLPTARARAVQPNRSAPPPPSDYGPLHAFFYEPERPRRLRLADLGSPRPLIQLFVAQFGRPAAALEQFSPPHDATGSGA